MAQHMEMSNNTAVLSSPPTTSRFGRIWQSWLWHLAGFIGAGRSVPRGRHLLLKTSASSVTAIVVDRAGTRKLEQTIAFDAAPNAWVELGRALRNHNAASIPLVVHLGDDLLLKKVLHLPAAVEDVLGPVIANQISRLSPWPENETVFGYRVLPSSGGHDRIDIEIAATHRDTLRRLQENLTAAKLNCARIEAAPAVDGQTGAALYDTGRLHQKAAARRLGWLFRGLAATALVIGIFGGYTAVQSYLVLADLDQRIAATDARIKSHLQTTGSAASKAGSESLLLERRRKQPPAIWVMNQLTRVVPDHTWLNELKISSRKVVFSGSSRDAAEVVTALEQSRFFASAQFAAATTRNRKENRENFTIAADIVFSMPKEIDQ